MKDFVVAVMASPETKRKILSIEFPESDVERASVIEEKVVPLAQDMGFDLNVSDFMKPAFSAFVDDIMSAAVLEADKQLDK